MSPAVVDLPLGMDDELLHHFAQLVVLCRLEVGLERLPTARRFFFFFTHLPRSRRWLRLHFASCFAVSFGAVGVVVAPGVGVGTSDWPMGGVKDMPSSEPLGELVDDPPGEVVDEPPGEPLGGALAVVKVCVSPNASCHWFSARRR